MASPEEIQAIWSRAIARFPQLAEKWGAQLPADTTTINSALTEYNSYIRPVGGRPVEDPTYFSTDYWKNIASNVGKFGGVLARGIKEDFTRDNPIAAILRKGDPDPRYEERLGKPDPETGRYSLGQMGMGLLEGASPGIQAWEDVVAPAAGMVAAGRLMNEPGIKERIDIQKERGGAWGPFGTLERYASSYQQARDAGELPWWKQAIAEAGGEVLLGGALGSLKSATRATAPSPLQTPPSPRAVVPETIQREVVGQYPEQQIQNVWRAGTGTGEDRTFGGFQPENPWSAFAGDMQQQFIESPEIPRPPRTVSDVGAMQQPFPDIDFSRSTLKSDEIQPDMFGSFSPEVGISDELTPMSAEDLAIRQMDDPTWEWSPGQAVGSLTTPSGKRRSPLRPDVTKTETKDIPSVYQQRIQVGKDIQDVSEFDALIPEDVKSIIDRLLTYRQKGIDDTTQNPGYKRWVSQWTDEVALAMFGNTDTASKNKVKAYIDTLPGQQELPFQDYGSMQSMFKFDIDPSRPLEVSNEWTKWFNDNYGLDESVNEFVPKPDRPLPPTKKSWMGVQLEKDLSEFINKKAPKRGKIPASNVGGSTSMPDLSKTSSWVNDKPALEGTIFDNARRVWREFATPDEMASQEGVLGYFRKAVEAPFKTIGRLYEGTIKSHDDYIADNIIMGTKELEELGWVDKKGEVLQSAIGTVDSPGDLRLLYYALHDRTWLPQVEIMAANYGDKSELVMRQYHNLRALTDMESTLREGGGLKLKIFNEESPEQYFYRGLVPEDLNWVKLRQKVRNYNNAARLGRTQSIEFKRIDKQLPELMGFGLQPIFWNPYKQAMFSSKLGLKVRMESELLNIFKHPSIRQADYIIKSENSTHTDIYDNLWQDGWREFEEGGPALRGERLFVFNKLLGKEPELRIDPTTNKLDPNTGTPINQELVWMFSPEAINVLKGFFGEKNWIEKGGTSTLKWKSIDMRLDDLIYIPKRIDLFGSVFQQVDFGQRALHSGPATSLESFLYSLRDLGQENIDKGTFFKEAFQAFNHTYRVPVMWTNMTRAFFSKGYREELRRMMLSTEDWYSDPSLKGFNNRRSRQVGLNTQDETVFLQREEGVKLVNDAVDDLKKEQKWKQTPKHIRQMVKDLEMWFRDGLFEGIYPAAIYHDYRYNIVPMVMKANRGDKLAMNPDQVMATAAKRANLNWSVIPQAQSVMKGASRSFLKRFLFSLNEQETFLRQFTGMFRGKNKAFFAARNVGSLFSMYLVANLIHYATTAAQKSNEEDLNLLDPKALTKGELLPYDRWIPFRFGFRYGGKISYYPQYLNPDVPVPGRDGENATVDIMNQYDMVFRMMDGTYGLPLFGGVSSRLGSVPRALFNQVGGEDFRGRDIGEWGYLQRAMQGVYDIASPIGIGQLLTALVVRNIGDKKLPQIGTSKYPLLAPGATVADVFPTEESKLGSNALGIQGLTGLNLKASTGKDLNDTMVRNLSSKLQDEFGKMYMTMDDVNKDIQNNAEIKQMIYNAPENAQLMNEKELRRREGYETYYDDGAKWRQEISESGYERLVKENALVEQLARQSLYNNDAWVHQGGTKKPWEPIEFNKSLSLVNYGHHKNIESITEKYDADPISAWAIANLQEMPSRSEQPILWAIWNYNELRKEHADPVTGKTNWDTFQTVWNEFTSQWDDEEAMESGGLLDRYNKYIESRMFLNDNHNPLVKEKYIGLEMLDKAGYWQDGIKYDENGMPVNDEFYKQLSRLQEAHAPRLAQLGMTAPEVWDKYLSENTNTRRLMRSDDGTANYAVWSIIKTMELVRKAHRYSVLIQGNGELDRIAIKWFNNLPTHPINVSYYEGLYGKPPSQIRQMPYR